MKREPKNCSVLGCTEKHHAKGMCSRHYAFERGMDAAVRHLSKGKVLCCHVSQDSENGRQWFSMPDGKRFPAAQAESLVSTGRVEPVGDALFAGESQTWRLRSGINA